MLYITLVKGHRCRTCTILHYCLPVDFSLDQIWVCTTAVIEKPPVHRDEMDISVHAVVLLHCLDQMGHRPGVISLETASKVN